MRTISVPALLAVLVTLAGCAAPRGDDLADAPDVAEPIAASRAALAAKPVDDGSGGDDTTCRERCQNGFYDCLSGCERGGGRPGSCFTFCEAVQKICELACGPESDDPTPTEIARVATLRSSAPSATLALP